MLKHLTAGFALLVVAASVAVASATPSPQTLVSVKGEVLGFSVDGTSLAWLESTSAGCRLRVRTLSTGSVRTVSYPGCFIPHDVAIAGQQVAVGGYDDVRCSETTASVYVAVGTHAKLVQEIPGDCLGGGTSYQTLGSDGQNLVYALLTSTRSGGAVCDNGGACTYALTGGSVLRITGTKTARLKLPPAALISAALGRVAVVPPLRSYHWAGTGNLDWPRAAANARIEIRNTLTGTLVTSFTPTGTVRAIALCTGVAVVLVQQGGAMNIDWYDSTTGKRIGVKPVPAGTAHEVETDGHYVAFVVGKIVHVLDLRNSAQSVLATTGTAPAHLAVWSGQVYWTDAGRLLRAAA